MALSTQERQKLQDIARELRLTVIDVMAWSGGAHVGGSLSIIDILTILYFKYLDINPADPQWDERDRFILSKGHAAAGLIPVLAKRGFFPEATLKVFLTASARVRAQRRYRQLLERGEPADLEALAQDLEARDKRDRERAAAPLRAAEDARTLDTSEMDIEAVEKKVLEWWRES